MTSAEPAHAWAPPGQALWDAWVVTVDGRHLLYHLAAPIELDKPGRDDAARIWLAESTDRVHWQSRGPVIEPQPGTWFDLSVWTGSTHRIDDGLVTFFTGRNRGRGLFPAAGDLERRLQFIFCARSIDGVVWQTSAEPLLRPPLPNEPGAAWYESRPDTEVYPAWRDPFWLRAPGGEHILLFTAQGRRHPDAPGAIGLAIGDEVDGPYRISAPLLEPGAYRQMECPVLLERDGRWYLFFSVEAEDYDPAWAEEVGAETGLHCWVASAWDGPYAPLGGTGKVPGLGTSSGLYSVRFVAQPDGELMGLGWHVPRDKSRRGDSPAVRPGVDAHTLSAPFPIQWPRGTDDIRGEPNEVCSHCPTGTELWDNGA